MLSGNKFYNAGLNVSKLPSEENYTSETTSLGSSYNKGYDIGSRASSTGYMPALSQYVNMNVPTNNPYQTIDNYQFALSSVGQTAPKRAGTGIGNALMSVLDLMQRPQYMITNMLDEVTDDQKSSFGDVLKGGLQGITGTRKSSITDTFDNIGWENDSSKKWYQGGNLLRNVAGFAGDVLLDPTTYLTAGTASLAKGLGTKAIKGGVGDAITKVLTETGSDVMQKSAVDVAEGIAKFTGKEVSEVTGAIAKQGKQGDLVSRLAYALGQSTDLTSSTAVKANQELVNNVLNKGVGALNRDVIKDNMLSPLKQQLGNVMANDMPSIQTAFNRSIGQSINKKLGGEFKFNLKGLEGEELTKQMDNIHGIVDAVTGFSKKAVNPEFKTTVVSKLYSGVDNAIPSNVLSTLSDKEYDILDTLCESFNVGSSVQADKLIKSAQNINNMGVKTVKKLSTVTTNLDEVQGVVKRIEGGIEFGNGIQRVFDTADKAFYLKYHNPFTGTVKPLIELTNVAQSDKARTAWNIIAEANPLSPVMGKLGDSVAHMFSTEYVSKRISKLDDGTIDLSRRDAAKSMARVVTQVMQKENAIPERAAQSIRIFKSIPEFFKDDNLRKAASIYIERNNSDLAKAGWLYLSKQGLEDGAEDRLVKAYDEILTNPVLRQTLDDMKFDPSKLSLVQKIGQQNTLYNTTIAQFDGTNKIDFKNSDMRNFIDVGDTDSLDYLTRAATGNIDQSRLEGYARIYDNTDNSYINPVAEPASGKSHHKKADTDVTATRLGGTVDSRASATSGTTGAYLHRSNKSALDALASKPTHDIDFDLATRVARRTMESERVALNKKFMESIDDHIDNVPGFDTLVSKNEFEGARKVPLMDGQVTLYCHPEIANQFSRVASVFDNASVSSQAVMETFTNVTNLLKTLQTKYNPSFILRNMIGEPMMNWVAGVSSKSHLDATSIMRDVDAAGLFKIGDTTFSADTSGSINKLFREYESEVQPGIKKNVLEYTNNVGTKEVADSIDINAQRKKIIESSGVNPTYYQIGARQMTAAEIMTEFYDHGLGWSGVTKGNQAKNMKGLLDEKMLSVTSQNGAINMAKRINEKVGAPGDAVETWTRLAHYIDGLSKGMDMQSAAMEVRKYHVDYKDLTTFERKYMRNLMPYYTYMRKNFPIQVRALVERQNKVNMIGQLVDSMYEAVQRDNGGEELKVPDYLKEGLAIPLGVDDNGNVQYLNWGIPLADVGRFKYDLKELLTENFFSMFSPMVKNPLEYTMNKSMMFGADLESYTGEEQQLLPGVEGSPQISTIADQAIQSLGVVNTARNAVAAGAKAGQEGGNALGAGLAKLLTGSIAPSKSQDDVALQQAYDYRDQLYAYIQKLRAQGIAVPQYTPAMQYNTPVLNPYAPSDRVAQSEKQGYLGTSNAQLYPGLLKILTGQGR